MFCPSFPWIKFLDRCTNKIALLKHIDAVIEGGKKPFPHWLQQFFGCGSFHVDDGGSFSSMKSSKEAKHTYLDKILVQFDLICLFGFISRLLTPSLVATSIVAFGKRTKEKKSP